MIEVKNVTKRFDDFIAVDDISITIRNGIVFGLLGTNGAGKSTLMRMMTGVFKCDAGNITIDGKDVYDNIEAKKKMFFIDDDYYFFAHGNALEEASYLQMIYENFDMEKFRSLMKSFGLDEKRRVSTFSKGMKKQLSIILGLSANTDYLLCDETFDGLDPAMRQAVKSLFANEIAERGLTTIIASHNLRELEDICDTVGLLHKGQALLSENLDDMKLNIHKVQCVFKNDEEREAALEKFDVVTKDQRGQLVTFTIRGEEAMVRDVLATVDTIFYEVLPLTLEEIFISETEVVGYDIKKLILEA